MPYVVLFILLAIGLHFTGMFPVWFLVLLGLAPIIWGLIVLVAAIFFGKRLLKSNWLKKLVKGIDDAVKDLAD